MWIEPESISHYDFCYLNIICVEGYLKLVLFSLVEGGIGMVFVCPSIIASMLSQYFCQEYNFRSSEGIFVETSHNTRKH